VQRIINKFNEDWSYSNVSTVLLMASKKSFQYLTLGNMIICIHVTKLETEIPESHSAKVATNSLNKSKQSGEY
jgi:hypothetical protein